MKILYYTGWSLWRIISKLIFRVKVTGRENFPKEGGFLLATNHISYYDPLMAGSWAPRQMYFLAKKELFKNRLFGAIIHRTNALPVSRGQVDREALRLSFQVIKNGGGLLIFPEGTRSKTADFLEPKLGIGMMAQKAQCPVIPGYIQGTNRLLDSFLGRVRMRMTYGEPIPADWIAAQSADKQGYAAIVNRIMDAIRKLRDESGQTNRQ